MKYNYKKFACNAKKAPNCEVRDDSFLKKTLQEKFWTVLEFYSV